MVIMYLSDVSTNAAYGGKMSELSFHLGNPVCFSGRMKGSPTLVQESLHNVKGYLLQ